MRKYLIIILSLILVCTLYSANVSSTPFGINAHLVPNYVLEKVKDAGIKWIRIDVNWFAVERIKDKFEYDEIDRVVNYAHSNGLSVFAVLAYTPGWANNGRGKNYPPDNYHHWVKFVGETVDRYKSKIKYWSIWNEPNLKQFFALGKDVFVEQIFLPAARAIQREDSSAFIVGPELAHLTSEGSEWFFWMKYILENAGNYLDVISHHIYEKRGVYYIYELLEKGEGFIPAVKEIIAETGHGDKPFWITETGWNTAEFSEIVQADLYLEILQTRKSKNYPHKIFFYEIIDDPTSGILPWGILRNSLAEKPAYGVYMDFIAGRYPDPEGLAVDDVESKKCYFQQLALNTSLIENLKILPNFRNLRNRVLMVSNSAEALVKWYYSISDELVSLSLADSRIFRQGLELVNGVNKVIRKNGNINFNQKMNPGFLAKAKNLIFLIKKKSVSDSLHKLLLWSEGALELLQRETVSDYLAKFFKQDVKKLSLYKVTDK